MSAFRQFVKKEVYHIIRDFRTLIVLFGMPVIQVVLFGFAIRTEITDAEIGILDQSRDNLTKQATDKLLSSGYFTLKAYIDSPDDIENTFANTDIKQIIVFEPKFSHKLLKEGTAGVQIINDASNPNTAKILNAYTVSILNDFTMGLSKAEGKGMAIIPVVKMLYNPELKSVYMFVPGLISFILLLVSALMTSIAITREKELGTMEVLLVSPLKPQLIIIGKVVPYIVLAFINAVTVMAIALTVFGIPFQGNILLFVFETILFILTALSLGIFISTVAKTQQVAMMISLAGLMMPSILLSGFIFPIENMPLVLQWVSNIIPSTWFLIIVKGIMLKGIGLEYLWMETLILVLMTIALIFLSIKKFKIRLE